MGGDKSVIDAGNKGGIHGPKSSLDSAICGLVGGVGGTKAFMFLCTQKFCTYKDMGNMLFQHISTICLH